MKQLFTILLFLCCTTAFAQNTNYFSKNGIAINGYDPVAYFTDSAAVEGQKEFAYDWMGVRWLFKNQANLKNFKSGPEKYAPQFGGYCAYGASENHLAPTEPAAFTIVDDKLYLNYNVKVRDLWRKDMQGRIKTANTYWNTLKMAKKQ